MQLSIFFLFFVLLPLIHSLAFDGLFHDCEISNTLVNTDLKCNDIVSNLKRLECESLQNIFEIASFLNEFHSIETQKNSKEIFYVQSKLILYRIILIK
jgi:hypothetical protein